MWLSLLIVIFILALAFFQAMQGVFSALIMTVLTLCCAALAVGTHEYVAIHYLSKWKPDYAYALSIALTFGVPLLVLRVLFDQTFRRSPLVPSMVDRIGGGLCGLLTALIIGGMTALALQLLPMDYSVLTYSRIKVVNQRKPDANNVLPEPLEHDRPEEELWLTPDRFAVAAGAALSNGLFSAERSISPGNPDIIQTYGRVNSTSSESSRFAPPGSVRVVKVDAALPYVYHTEPDNTGSGEYKYEPVPLPPGQRYVAVRLALDAKAKNTRFQPAKHSFSLRQIRLVGRESGDSDWVQYYPIAVESIEEPHKDKHILTRMSYSKRFHVVDDVFEPLPATPDEIEVVFQVPASFSPVFIEYKLGARAPLSLEATSETGENTDRPTGDATTSARPDSTPPPRSTTAPPTERGGRVRKYTTNTGRSRFGDGLPLTLKKYSEFNDVEVTRGKIANGHLVALLAEQDEAPAGKEASGFVVPEDKRLLQLNVSHLQAQSTYGKAVSRAIGVASNFYVEGEGGEQYKIVGKYAVADVNGEEVCEVQYFPEQIGSIGGLGAFRRIRDADLAGDYELVLLFLVDPGVSIKYFSTGGSNARRDDLSGESLKAPG
jgi:uncharacterized membrane protein required for colicin V production